MAVILPVFVSTILRRPQAKAGAPRLLCAAIVIAFVH